MIKLNQLTPNIMVDDIDQTIAFYMESLGFSLAMRQPPEGAMDWAMLQRDEVVLMFQTRPSLSGELPLFEKRGLGGGLTFYVRMEGVRELFGQLGPEVRIVKGLNTTFYGATEFVVEDPNGCVLTFAEFQSQD